MCKPSSFCAQKVGVQDGRVWTGRVLKRGSRRLVDVERGTERAGRSPKRVVPRENQRRFMWVVKSDSHGRVRACGRT